MGFQETLTRPINFQGVCRLTEFFNLGFGHLCDNHIELLLTNVSELKPDLD